MSRSAPSRVRQCLAAGHPLGPAIVKSGNSYVCRLRDNRLHEIAEKRPLTDADRQVHVLNDQIVRIGLSGPSTGSSRATGDREGRTSREPQQISGRLVRRGQRRLPANHHQPARRPRRNHRSALRSPLADRSLLSHGQTPAGPLRRSESSPRRDQESNRLHDHSFCSRSLLHDFEQKVAEVGASTGRRSHANKCASRCWAYFFWSLSSSLAFCSAIFR